MLGAAQPGPVSRWNSRRGSAGDLQVVEPLPGVGVVLILPRCAAWDEILTDARVARILAVAKAPEKPGSRRLASLTRYGRAGSRTEKGLLWGIE